MVNSTQQGGNRGTYSTFKLVIGENGDVREILTFKTSHYRNLFVAAMSAAIFVAHAAHPAKPKNSAGRFFPGKNQFIHFTVITTRTLSKWVPGR
ncbi:MAG: hypothetical protein JRE64_10025 [Deltaproteobacteria bacterium]|nr:hypothetical protein [Deltaproteobacteria bacterium]